MQGLNTDDQIEMEKRSGAYSKVYMKFALNNSVFFCKIIVGYKMKIKGVIEDLIFLNLKTDNGKIYI